MRMKSYFADSLQEAMDQARNDLGPDAMLVSSRKTGADLRDLGTYEVVFGVDANGNGHVSASDSSPVVNASVAASPYSHSESSLSTDAVLRELAEMRRQMETFAQTVNRSHHAQATEQFTPEFTRVYERLITTGFSDQLAREVVEAAAANLPAERNDAFNRELLRTAVEQEISSRFSVEPKLGEEGASSTAVMLVGPPGAGKTSTLVKLALQYGVKARRPVHLLSLDTLRVGGCDQLQRYARILGTSLQPLDSAAALQTELENKSRVGLTLIDTPGFAPADEADLRQLALAARQLPIEIHLVLPAYMRLDAALRLSQRFAIFHPSRLLLTHVDSAAQTTPPGAAIELAIKTALPLSFLGTGQQVPEDLKEADKAALVGEVTPRERAAASRAA